MNFKTLFIFCSALVAVIVPILYHYCQDTLTVTVNIHRKSHERTLPNSWSRSITVVNPKVEQLSSTKLKELPAHTLESMHKNCSDPLCLEHLSISEKVYFDMCKQKTISIKSKLGPITNTKQCRFQNGTNRVPVALASFPGSGNTWVRGLLEKVTGFCTGALACDGSLRTKGFSGEGIRGPSALVIKTHDGKGAQFSNNKLQRVRNDVPVYGGAIFIVRDPRKALIAEWNRERSKIWINATVSSHYLYVGQEYFGTNEEWDKYVKRRAEMWKANISRWIVSGKYNPFLIVRYEDLKKNTAKEVLKMVEFLGFKGLFTEASIHEKLGAGYNGFYRNHQDDFEHFTVEQKVLIRRTVRETISLLAEQGLEHSFPIMDYL